jgi:hypothetical protein
MSGGKKTSAPDMSGVSDDWTRLARLRQENSATLAAADDPEAPAPAPEVTHAQHRAAEAAAIRRASQREEKTRRSWYTSTEAADAFTAAVDDIHHATRVPKHEVVAALMKAAVARASDVEKQLARIAPMRRVRDVR